MNRNAPVRMFQFAIRTAIVSFFVSSAFLAQPALAACCKCVALSDPGKNICLTGEASTCGDLVNQTSGLALQGIACDPITLTDAQCQTIASGGSGICSNPPVAAEFFTKADSEKSGNAEVPVSDDDIYPPKLNIPIPGLRFASRVVVDGGEAVIPFLAQYISAIYRYLLAIVVIAAAVMIVYGGFHYILGTTLSSIDRGKSLIRDSIIGLILVFSAHVILVTLNPALVDLKGLKVSVIAQKAFTDLQAERRRVMESATVPGQSSTGGDVPVVVLGEDGKTLVSSPPDPSTPPAPNKLPPGTVVQDASGVYVAQRNCPADMVAIRNSDAYTAKIRKNVPSFCMDVYEAPNQVGAKPYNGVAEWEADWYCSAQGKRLCTDSEWTRACLGPEGVNTYGYGPTYKPGLYVSSKVPNTYGVKKAESTPAPCNYDTVVQLSVPPDRYHTYHIYLKVALDSILNPNIPGLDQEINKKKKELVDFIREQNKKMSAGVEPSGKRPGCVTAEGVFDMTANVQEIIISDGSVTKTTEQRVASGGTIGADYRWAGFYFSPIAHLANTSAEPTCTQRWGGGHGVNWRGFENGFRCCMPLNENP